VLGRAFDVYNRAFLDPDLSYGGTFHQANYFSRDKEYGKSHCWKSGFHEAEHALIAHMTSAARRNAPATLYYALPTSTPTPASVQPHFFKGAKLSENRSALELSKSHTTLNSSYHRVEVKWLGLHLLSWTGSQEPPSARAKSSKPCGRLCACMDRNSYAKLRMRSRCLLH